MRIVAAGTVEWKETTCGGGWGRRRPLSGPPRGGEQPRAVRPREQLSARARALWLPARREAAHPHRWRSWALPARRGRVRGRLRARADGRGAQGMRAATKGVEMARRSRSGTRVRSARRSRAAQTDRTPREKRGCAVVRPCSAQCRPHRSRYLHRRESAEGGVKLSAVHSGKSTRSNQEKFN